MSHITNFSTGILDCETHVLALLELLFSWSASLCSKVASGMSGASKIVVLDISKVFARVWHLVLFFGLSSFFLSNQWHRMVVNGKSASEFLSMLIFFSASFWALSFFPAIN